MNKRSHLFRGLAAVMALLLICTTDIGNGITIMKHFGM